MLRLVAGGLLAGALATAWLMRQRQLRASRQLQLAVLNPFDGSLYNSSVLKMLRELFSALGLQIVLHEVNVCEPFEIDYDAFDGFIIPGSHASAYDNLDWVERLAQVLRTLHAERRPMLGICFGHQIIASALGDTAHRPPILTLRHHTIHSHPLSSASQSTYMTLSMSCRV
jgi:anthranilate/para-aminobenzoate synthase component II